MVPVIRSASVLITRLMLCRVTIQPLEGSSAQSTHMAEIAFMPARSDGSMEVACGPVQ